MDFLLGWTELHEAAATGNVEGVIHCMKRINVNARTAKTHDTPFLVAFKHGNFRLVELMLCQRTRRKKWLMRRFNEVNYIVKEEQTAEDRLVPMNGNSVLDDCILQYPKTRSILITLIANGARLDTVWPRASLLINDEIRDIEDGILDCRDAVIALLSLARRGYSAMTTDLALAVWVTRKDWVENK